MIGYIYLTVNDINEICYIGKRQKPSFDRAYKGSGTHLKLAFAKYGRDKFHSYILEECNSAKELCKAEKRWIAKFKEMGVELYNIGEGGEGGNMVNWGSLPAERREAINEKNRQSHLGGKNLFYGKHHTAQTKAVLREKNKRNSAPHQLLEYKQRQRDRLPKIMQISKETGEVIAIWDNWCIAGRALIKTHRLAYSHISECCKGTRKTAYGYKWEVVGA
jgi:group I intron endonuclease